MDDRPADRDRRTGGQMTVRELSALMDEVLPAIDRHGEEVEAVAPDGIRLRLPYRDSFVRHNVYSGPLMLGFADTALFAAIHAVIGTDRLAMFATFNASFLRPGPPGDLIAEARVVRLGSRIANAEVYIRAVGTGADLAHVTATYTLVPRDKIEGSEAAS